MSVRDRILLVEDSRTQAIQLSAMLTNAGFGVVHAQSAAAAMEAIGREIPRLILIDYYLPGTRGDELCKQIRMRIDTRLVPIVILTGDSAQQVELSGLESGADDFVAKTVDHKVLLLRLRALLSKSRPPCAPSVSQETVLRQARLLAVDDSSTYLTYLVEQLRPECQFVETASSGKEALERLTREQFDCVLVDRVMPGMDGIELCRQINAMGNRSEQSVMVLMLTAKEDNLSLAQALEAGADDFVGKSSDVIVVKGRIRALLRRKFYDEEHRRRLSAELHAKELETERERMHKEAAELAARTHLLSSALSHIPHRVFWKDRDSVYLGCNENYAHETGLDSPDLIVGKSDSDLSQPAEQADRERASDQLIIGSGLPLLNREEQLRREDGTVQWRLCSKVPLKDSSGNVAGLLGLSVDITEQKQVEADLRRARDDAEAGTRARSGFLANMSHELRTPLNGVIGMLGLLLGTELSTRQRRLAQVAKYSGDALLALINDILDFSKIDAGKLEILFEDFDLHRASEDVVAMLAHRAADKHLEIACHINDQVPTWVRGDSNRLRQILTNLINNAIKFTENGAVVVEITPGPKQDDKVLIRFDVTDTGVGIAADNLGRLFKAFSQADAATTRAYGGTGLGLAISKQLAELMGGNVGVNSSPGKGSTFWFTVAFDLVDDSQHARVPLRINPKALRILAIDDNERQRKVLEQQIAGWGISVATTGSGARALEMLGKAAATKHPFDLAIVDSDMPEMDGYKLAGAIRSDPRLKHTALIMLLPIDESADPERLSKLGISSHIAKPVRQSELFDTIADALGKPTDGALPRFSNISVTKLQTPGSDPNKPQETLQILVAEDNEINQLVVREILQTSGYHCDMAENGQKAIGAVRQKNYDLVLMDCQMPVRDGFDATREIRKLEQAGLVVSNHGRRLPIIALTASAMRGDREQCLEAGMDDYLSKPIDPKHLLETIRRLSRFHPDVREAA